MFASEKFWHWIKVKKKINDIHATVKSRIYLKIRCIILELQLTWFLHLRYCEANERYPCTLRNTQYPQFTLKLPVSRIKCRFRSSGTDLELKELFRPIPQTMLLKEPSTASLFKNRTCQKPNINLQCNERTH